MTDCTCCHHTRDSGPGHRGYRDFLREPAVLFTIASGFLLAGAIVANPGLMLHDEVSPGNGEFIYLAAALVGSSYIWYSALCGIRRKQFTSDIPVSLATIAAIAIGQYPAAAVVAVLMLVGDLLEDYVAARADNAMEALAALLPDRVTVRRGGRDTTVPLEEVAAGDLVLVRSGERVPVDGTVVAGTASVNQATITGESVPVTKTCGDTVYAGTFNDCGAVEIRTEKTGDRTLIGRIRDLIAESKSQKPHVERMLDRYARLYTPAALLFGALVWLWSGDILRTITMLIVFCPCAIVLATPAALVASIGNAARHGNLVKSGLVIELMTTVDTVVFDKTGTLTIGKPVLAGVCPLGGCDPDELVRLAARAEKFSEHPLGRAVTGEALRRNLSVPDPDSFTVLPGRGVTAVIDSRPVVLGNETLMAEQGIAIPEEAAAVAAGAAQSARTAAFLAVDGTVTGVFAFEDAPRENAAEIVTQLTAQGIRCVMVTGDQEGAAFAAAKTLGITEAHANVLPHEKVDIVRSLQAAGRRVVFVGDGVNDGPALAAADVGIAMGLSGTDVAIETADIALLSDDLTALPYLHSLSKKALTTIRHNLIFSVGVLVVAVVLTVHGILTPVTGALVHELSSLPVIANAVLLIGYTVK